MKHKTNIFEYRCVCGRQFDCFNAKRVLDHWYKVHPVLMLERKLNAKTK